MSKFCYLLVIKKINAVVILPLSRTLFNCVIGNNVLTCILVVANYYRNKITVCLRAVWFEY